MNRNRWLSGVMAMAVVLGGSVLPTGVRSARAELGPNELKRYANELNSAFPGQVDIYLIGRDFTFNTPGIPDAHIAGCAEVAGVLYYVVILSNRSEMFVPQGQVLAIHNRK